MKLVTIEDEMPVFNPEVRVIVEFNRILMRDKGSEGDADGRKKRFALRELAFVHFYCAFDSRFDLYDTEEERIEAIKKAVGLPDDWIKDSLIDDAINRYSDMMKTESMKLVENIRKAIQKLEGFIATHEVTDETNSGTLVFGPDKMQKLIEGTPSMIRALNEAKQIVAKELEDMSGKNKRIKSMAESSFNKAIDGKI